jgi:ABC-2 type transport system permease protein
VSLFSSALWLQFRLLSRSPFFMSMALLTPIIYGTIAAIQAGQGTGSASVRLILGAGLLGAWSTTLYGAAEALFMQRFSGTLEVMIGAPRGLFVPVLGFSTATVLLGLYSVAAVWVWTVLVFGVRVDGPSAGVLVASVAVSFIGLAAVGLLLAGLYVVTRQAMEITNVAEYPVWIVCGVLAPAATLWPPLAWIGKLLPLGWSVSAMDAKPPSAAWASLAIALVLSGLYLLAGTVVLARVDLLARVKGTLRLR